MNKKFTSTLAGAFIFISAIGLLSRGLGFFREVLFANYFGLGTKFDIYLIGAVFPLTINAVFLYMGQNYFIPTYNKIKLNNVTDSKNFLKYNLLLFALSTLLITILLFVLSDTIINIYLRTTDTEIAATAINIFKIFLISLPLNSIISILIAYNQAELKFNHPALSRLFLNIAIIPFIIFFADTIGIYTIPIGYIIGISIQLVYLIIKSRLKVTIESFNSFDRRKYIKFLDFTIVGVLVIETIGQLYMITDRYFFNQISEGGLSALSYAMNLYLLPISIFSFALATVVFPKFSEYLQKKEYKVFEKNFMDAIRVNLLIFIPIALIYFFYGEELIKILFERGKFTGANSASTFLVLRIYSVSLIFYSIYSILNKVLYGAKLVNALFLIATTGLIIKIVLNFILVNEYQQNGLAIATSISFIFYFFSSIILIYVKFELQNKSFLGKEIIFYACNGLISYFVVFIFSKTLALTFSHNQIIQLILFCILFYMNLLIVKHNSISLLKTMLTSMGSK